MGLLIFLAPSMYSTYNRPVSDESPSSVQQSEQRQQLQQSECPGTSQSSSASNRRYQRVIFRDVASREEGVGNNVEPAPNQQHDDHVEDIEEVNDENEADMVALVPEELSGEDVEGAIDDGELLMDDSEHSENDNHSRHRKFHFRFLRNRNRNGAEDSNSNLNRDMENSPPSSSASSILLKIPNFLRTNLFSSIFQTNNNNNTDNHYHRRGSSRKSSNASNHSGAVHNHEQQNARSSRGNVAAAASSQVSLATMGDGDCQEQNNNGPSEMLATVGGGAVASNDQRISPSSDQHQSHACNNISNSNVTSKPPQPKSPIINEFYYYFQTKQDNENKRQQSDNKLSRAWCYGRSNLLAYSSIFEQTVSKNRTTPPMLFRHETFKFKKLNDYAISPNISPLPRSGHRLVSDKHYVYLFGGFNPAVAATAIVPDANVWRQSKPLLKELWRYSKLTQTWQYLPTSGTAPIELASHCACMIGQNRLLVYGGSGMPFGAASSNKLYICELDRLFWYQVIPENPTNLEPPFGSNNLPEWNPDIPESAYGQALAYDACKQMVYVCGGTTGFDYSLNLYEFNMKTKIWKLLSLTPENIEPRYRHEMAVYDNKLFVIGGGTPELCFSMEEIPVFDLSENKWSLCPAKPWKSSDGQDCFPPARYSFDIGQRGRIVFMVGGADQDKAFDDCWSIDLVTLTWTKHEQATLPQPCFFHSATIDEDSGEMFVFGGVNCVKRKRRSNAIYRCWFGVPSLQRLAQEAMMKYIQYSLDSDALADGNRHKYPDLKITYLREYFNCMDVNHQILNLPDI